MKIIAVVAATTSISIATCRRLDRRPRGIATRSCSDSCSPTTKAANYAGRSGFSETTTPFHRPTTAAATTTTMMTTVSTKDRHSVQLVDWSSIAPPTSAAPTGRRTRNVAAAASPIPVRARRTISDNTLHSARRLAAIIISRSVSTDRRARIATSPAIIGTMRSAAIEDRRPVLTTRWNAATSDASAPQRRRDSAATRNSSRNSEPERRTVGAVSTVRATIPRLTLRPVRSDRRCRLVAADVGATVAAATCTAVVVGTVASRS